MGQSLKTLKEISLCKASAKYFFCRGSKLVD
jgi:hypothetical protein